MLRLLIYVTIVWSVDRTHCFLFKELLKSVVLQSELGRVFQDEIVENLVRDEIVPRETGLNATERIRFEGYPLEIHEVTTVDGYILQLHRIPYGNNRNVSEDIKKLPVLLIHCLFCDSSVFLFNGPKQSLGFLLADQGYDVWLGNTRGTPFSRQHKEIDLNLEPEKFFNYSLTEKALYDLPAMIDYVLTETGKQDVYYIGHSEGTTLLFILAAEKVEYNKKIRLGVCLGPVAYLNNTAQILLRVMSLLQNKLMEVFQRAKIYELLPHSRKITTFAAIFCNDFSPLQYVCKLPLQLITGVNTKTFNDSLLPVIFSSLPAGASLKQMAHYSYFIKSGRFSYYNYKSSEQNLAAYGEKQPPDYKINKIKLPIALYYGLNDIISVPKDVQRFASELDNVVVNQAIVDQKFGHTDFLWSSKLKELVNDHVIEVMYKYK